MNMSEKLKLLRGDKTQEQVVKEIAERTGEKIGITSYRLYEAGERTSKDTYEPIKARQPSLETLKALAKYFQVDIRYLIYDNIESPIEKNIDISKELALSDKAIENLKYIINKNDIILGNVRTELNDLLANANLVYMLQDIKTIKRLSIIYNFIYDNIYREQQYSLDELKEKAKKLLELLDSTIDTKERIKEFEEIKQEIEASTDITEASKIFDDYLKNNLDPYIDKAIKVHKYETTEFVSRYLHDIERSIEFGLNTPEVFGM